MGDTSPELTEAPLDMDEGASGDREIALVALKADDAVKAQRYSDAVVILAGGIADAPNPKGLPKQLVKSLILGGRFGDGIAVADIAFGGPVEPSRSRQLRTLSERWRSPPAMKVIFDDGVDSVPPIPKGFARFSSLNQARSARRVWSWLAEYFRLRKSTEWRLLALQ